MLPLLIIAVCAVWVYIDSRRRGIVKSGNSIGQSGPIGWALITLLLWIVGFPWYLIKTRGWKGSAMFVAVASLLFAGPYLVTTWIIPLKGAVESKTGRPSPSAPLPSSPRTAQCEPLGVSYNQAIDGLSQFFTMQHTRLYDGR